MSSIARIGRQQFKIMRILWDKGEATAREIAETLNQRESSSFSSVQTLLRQLEKKGAVSHKNVKYGYGTGTYIYRPLMDQDHVRSKATHEFLERLFDGSPGGLIAHLLEHEDIPPKELKAIREQIEPPLKASGRKRGKGKT